MVIPAPKPGKACPQLRLRWLSGHQNPAKRARSSASGGCPGTKTRQSVPAAPPQVVVRAPKPGKTCPQLRPRWLSGHQNPGKRARSSALDGYPDTKTRESVPAAPPFSAFLPPMAIRARKPEKMRLELHLCGLALNKCSINPRKTSDKTPPSINLKRAVLSHSRPVLKGCRRGMDTWSRH